MRRPRAVTVRAAVPLRLALLLVVAAQAALAALPAFAASATSAAPAAPADPAGLASGAGQASQAPRPAPTSPISPAAPVVLFPLRADALAPEAAGVDLRRAGWKYRPGDDLAWGDPALDDSGWETLPTSTIGMYARPSSGWQGIAWFRLAVDVDPQLVARPVAVWMSHWGASELYLDGRLINRYGTVGATSATERPFSASSTPGLVSPPILTFETAGRHVFAVRLSCAYATTLDPDRAPWAVRADRMVGFDASLADAASSIRDRHMRGRYVERLFVAMLTVCLAFAVLHGFLFAFYPALPGNALFAIVAASFGLTFGLSLFAPTHSGLGWITFVALTVRALFAVTIGGLLAFLHVTFFGRVPRYLRWYAVGLALSWAAYVIVPSSLVDRITQIGVVVFFLVEGARICLRAFRQGLHDVWILSAGLLLVTATPLSRLLSALQIRIPGAEQLYALQLSMVGLFLSASIYLARQVGRTNRALQATIAEVRELGQRELAHQRREADLRLEQERERAEHARRTKELEDARKLQLSMLPEHVPQVGRLDIAVYMKPATEVGGDYYDFDVADDGTLAIAVGDATGHGLRAGTMVTAAKSLFHAHKRDADLEEMLSGMSAVLQDMGFDGLYMAMQIVRIAGDRLTIASAGMPPALVYRAALQRVEPLSNGAPPLGMPVPIPFDAREHRLAPGDVVVLMSDGFPERFNPADEMLGYDQVPDVVRRIVADAGSAAVVVERLVDTGDTWAKGRPQDDDVTFVVVRNLA